MGASHVSRVIASTAAVLAPAAGAFALPLPPQTPTVRRVRCRRGRHTALGVAADDFRDGNHCSVAARTD